MPAAIDGGGSPGSLVLIVALVVGLWGALWLSTYARDLGHEAFNAGAQLLSTMGSFMAETACTVRGERDSTYTMREFDGLLRHPSAQDTCYLRPNAGDGLLDAQLNACKRGSTFDGEVVADVGVAPVMGFDRCVVAMKPGLPARMYSAYEAGLRDAAIRRSPLYIQLQGQIASIRARISQLEAERAQLQTQADASSAEYRRLYGQLLQIQATIARARQLEQQRAAEIKQLTDRYMLTAAQAADLEMQRQKAIADAALREQDAVRVRSQMESQAKTMQSLQGEISDRERQISSLRSEVAAIQQRMADDQRTATQQLSAAVAQEQSRAQQEAQAKSSAALAEARSNMGGFWYTGQAVGAGESSRISTFTTTSREACARACFTNTSCTSSEWEAGKNECRLYRANSSSARTQAGTHSWAKQQVQTTSSAGGTGLPAGSYAQSCDGCSVAFGRLICSNCKRLGGMNSYNTTSIAVPCEGEITNNDGLLQCRPAR